MSSAAASTIPTGTVTFLFTDVEGSTRLWEANPDRMAAALRRHDVLVRDAIEVHAGFVFSTAGDAFSAAFARVADAVAAARAAQTALSGEPWPEGAEIRVRIGLHTGEADERGGDYFGPAVNRAARIMDAGHGGQVLVSDVTASLVDRVELRDLGEHVLKSFDEPIRLHQLPVDGLPAEFPQVRSAGAVASTIRAPLSETVGRTGEIASLIDLLTTNRLVTLTGAGGCGKTRLAVEVGNRSVPTFTGGVFFVDLSPVSSEDMVTPALADGLGVTVQAGTTGLDVARSFLGQRDALLVVDNCEHVIDEAAEVIEDLLTRCPKLRVLTTSREPLQLDGEQVVRVGGLAGDEAVALFRTRSGVSEGPDEVIAEICARLDGLPLAIELAAARTAVVPVEEIRRNLDDRFALLTGGRRRTRGRQQTLEATVEWSYDLLDAEEQRCLRALSVMPGSFGLELAAGVLQCSRIQAIEMLESLAARSLLQSDPTASDRHDRFRLLETIRAFAATQLRQAGEDRTVRDLHVDALVAVLHPYEYPLFEAADGDVRDDLFAAHDWLLASGDDVRARPLAFAISMVLGTVGAFDRADRFVEWVATSAGPETMAKMAAVQTMNGVWAADVDRVLGAAQLAVDADPDSVGAALAKLNRAVMLTSAAVDRAQRDIDSARPAIEASPEPHLHIWLQFTSVGVELWRENDEVAVACAREMLEIAGGHAGGEVFARAALLNALSLRGDRVSIEALLATPLPRASKGSWVDVAYSLPASDGIGMACVGRVADGRRHIASLWDRRIELGMPLLNSELLLALALCARAAGERDHATAMLDDTIWVTRNTFAAAHLYRLLADLAGISPEASEQWRNDEFFRRLDLREQIDGERRVEQAIQAELLRLGLV